MDGSIDPFCRPERDQSYAQYGFPFHGGESRDRRVAMSFFMNPEESAPTKNWASRRKAASSGSLGAPVDPACRCALVWGSCVLEVEVCVERRPVLFFFHAGMSRNARSWKGCRWCTQGYGHGRLRVDVRL